MNFVKWTIILITSCAHFMYFFSEFGKNISKEHNSLLHLVAGATAGFAEHVCMFPVDTIKTRMQSLYHASPQHYATVSAAVSQIMKQDGVRGLYSGMSAVIVGAIPSHGLYFATYEAVKKNLKTYFKKQEKNKADYEYKKVYISGIAGAMATIAHDAIATPIDVVKQRMQLHGTHYRSLRECFATVWKREGFRGLYLSYPTTLLMNIPYASTHFITYELVMDKVFNAAGNDDNKKKKKNEYNIWKHVCAGGTAGAVAAAISTPFDVIKTQLQTQGHYIDNMTQHTGISDAAKHIYQTQGLKGFMRGIVPRMLYFWPSAAITWSTYEYIKWMYNSLVTVDDDNNSNDKPSMQQQQKSSNNNIKNNKE